MVLKIMFAQSESIKCCPKFFYNKLEICNGGGKVYENKPLEIKTLVKSLMFS